MPKFLIVIRTPTEPVDPPPTDAERGEMHARYEAWVQAMGDRLLAAERLKPREGRVVPAKSNGAVTDGPYLETKEMLAGFWLVEAADYAAAVGDAQRLPLRNWTLEVREVAPLS